jgi:hypothetical protein
MTRHYEAAQIIELGNAQDVVRGSSKGPVIFDDSPSETYRETVAEDDE